MIKSFESWGGKNMSPPTFIKDDVKNEKELHELIEKEIEALEPGIKILKYEFPCGDRGIADFLYVDSGNRLGIIEVKKDQDEDMLFQGLRYYDWVNKNSHAVANMFPGGQIDGNQSPRLTLIARSFSDDLRSLSTHVIPEVELFSYSVLKDKDGKRGMDFNSVSLPKTPRPLEKTPTTESVINYITDEKLRKLFREKIKEIKSINNKITTRATNDYVGFYYKGRMIANLYKHRKSFDITAVKIDDKSHFIENSWTRVETGDEDYSTQIEIIKDSIKKLGGN